MDRTNKKNAAELYYPKSMRFRSNPYCTHKLVEQIYEILDWVAQTLRSISLLSTLVI